LFDVVVSGGTLITPAGPVGAGLGIEGGRIVALGDGLSGRTTLDATGLLVLPGAVDPHVHLQMPAGAVTSSDTWETGTVAAACGGTTTVIDFVEPESTGPDALLRALAARRAEAEGQAVIDFALHMTLVNAGPASLAEVPAVVEAGCTSFKTYTTYEGFKLDDSDLLAVYAAVGAAGGVALVHAENDAIIDRARSALIAAGRTDPAAHPLSRPAVAEAEAVARTLSLAEAAGCPLYVVHVSTGRGAEAVALARGRGQAAWGETCPQYLLLTDAEYARPGFEGAKFVCSPPLRTAADRDALWRALAAGNLAAAGTDHCPFFYEGDKDLGRPGGALPPFHKIPGGMPGIETRFALLFSEGVAQGRLSLERWVDVCCAAPARVFGLYPRKGALVEGADADVVLFEPGRQVKLSRDLLQEHCDYTPYEGMAVRGWTRTVLRGGKVIVRDGRYTGGAGGGRYLARRPGEGDDG
jgi:dihydropyrimidinase